MGIPLKKNEILATITKHMKPFKVSVNSSLMALTQNISALDIWNSDYCRKVNIRVYLFRELYVIPKAIIVHNVIKFQAWTETNVNFLFPVRSPLFNQRLEFEQTSKDTSLV